MEENRSFNDHWTSIVLDEKLKILEVKNPVEELLFGKWPATGKTIVESFPRDLQGHTQAARIVDGIERAQREKRNVFLEYISTANGKEVPVVMHIQYMPEGGAHLHAMAVDAGDMERAKTPEQELPELKALSQTIYDNLPLGLEIYDRDGFLIEINPQELRLMGIEDKSAVLGLNIFENPNVPDEVKAGLRAGKDMEFTAGYDFALAEKEYFHTSRQEKSHFFFAISVVRDANGDVEKYLVISQDVTEKVLYQNKYENLYQENITILNSLPIGVGIYGAEGSFLYCNDAMEHIFGVKFRDMEHPVNILNNPVIPTEMKDALRNRIPMHARFLYDFNRLNEEGYFKSKHAQSIYLDCFGQPLIAKDGSSQAHIFIAQDVTEAVDNEEKLRQSKQKMELAMHDADIMVWELDVRNKLFYSNNDPINGYDPEKAIPAQVYIDSIHPEDRAIAAEVVRRMLSGEDWSFDFETRMLFPNNSKWQYCTISGSPYEKDANGKVTKFVGSRKNNTELQKKKALQENLLNNLPMPIHIKDVENNFRYVFCNEESSRMFGSSIDKTIYDVMDEEQVARIEKTDKEVFTTGEPYFGLEHIILKDGRSYDTIVRKSIIYDGDKRLLLNVRWDQSLQNDLERRAKVLSLSMQAMNAYTWYYDPDTNHVSFGEGFERSGRTAGQIDSLEKFAEVVHPDDRSRFIDSMQTLLKEEKGEWAVEYRVALNGNGEYEWWETRGILETSIINDAPCRYMLGMSINIDAHKKTELTLRKNREELKKLIKQNELVLNNTNSGLAYITPDYIVQWENISMCSASLSYEAYKKGEHCYKSAHNRTSPCENCIMQRALDTRQTEQVQFTLNNARTVEIFGTPVLREDGTIDGIVIRVDDITERNVMIEELKQAKALAEQSDKLKSAFLANMSHEIRTPLNAIVGFSGLLMTADDTEERDEYIQIINNNNELLLKLINDILDLSKIEAGSVELKYEEFDLSEYFDGMAASMKQRVANPNIRLIDVNPYPVCIVKLDRNRIAQILTNYVTNAIKYTPKGFIEMGYECVDEGIRFYVKDSGIGIAEEKKDKVFHRFEKLDEFAQGTGLGLSICKAIAESMGGQVGFESTIGEGSLFWAMLPCDPEIRTNATGGGKRQEECGNENSSGSAVESSTRMTILIAEDIASNYLLISALLKKHFDLLHALNGKEAVEMARTQHPDLVFMDMKMPVMDGLTATAEIRKFNTELPVVALTAHAFDADRQAAFDAGCNDYLVKPIDKVKLMALLRKYCNTPEIGK